MNIMELCLGPGLGGLELYVYRASLKLAETDTVHVVISQKGQLAKRFAGSGLHIHYLEKGLKLFPLFKAYQLACIIDAYEIDTIHMHWGKDLSLAALAKWLSNKKPRLVYTRQMQITRSKDDFYHRFLYRQVDAFVAITKVLEKLARSYLGASAKEKVMSLYYGVTPPNHILSNEEKQALKEQLGFDRESFVVGLFGRIEEYKGQHVLIEAIIKLKQREHNVKGLLVGHVMNNNYMSGLVDSVANNGIKNNVHFMDFVENPQDWMQCCDVVVLATKEETFGLVLAEAMHAGIPVIGTNSGGVPEIIDHGITGFLFEYGDADALSEQIIQLKNDKVVCRSMGLAGQKKARQLFAIDTHYEKLRKIMANAPLI